MKKNLLLAIPMLFVALVGAKGQSLWTTVDMKVELAKGVNVNVGGENRATDGIDGFARWSASAGLDYKPVKWLKISTGYTYIYKYTESRTTAKGNTVASYWQPRHRFSFALTGIYKVDRFSFSLRERYQYTYRPDKYVEKYDEDGSRKDKDEYIETKGIHDMRSRLEVDYDIRKSGFSPYASFEIYNNLADGFATKKTRWTVGTEYKLNKTHSFHLYYRYIDNTDDDDCDNHVIGLGYTVHL